jgi:hypothetical protein
MTGRPTRTIRRTAIAVAVTMLAVGLPALPGHAHGTPGAGGLRRPRAVPPGRRPVL